jgi:large subunit ribosomal protein L16
MLSPKRTKFRKRHKGRTNGLAKGGNAVSFGDFGLQVLEPGWITARQIEAARVAISRVVKKSGKLYVRIFPDKPITKKPAETRMGTGKGGVEGWVAVVKPGRVIFEVEGVSVEEAREAFNRAHHKLPVDTHLISREGGL